MQPTPEQQAILDAASRGEGRLLTLSRGLVTIVDNHRYDEFAAMGKWSAFDARGFFYAGKKVSGKLIMLARYIVKPAVGLIADHKNGNTLDNREHNLREFTRTKNKHNSHNLRHDNSSGFEGVAWDKNQNKWVAYISAHKVRFHLGSFETREAALAVRTKAIEIVRGADICQTSTLLQNNKQFLLQSGNQTST